MPSVGETIVQAMAVALNAPDDRPCTTYRSRIDAIATRELPVFVLYAIKESPAMRKSPSIYLRTRTVRLEAIVEGEAPADSLTDDLYVYAVNTLLADTNLAAQIRKLWQSEVQWESVSSYQDRSIAYIDFEVEFVTREDPTVRVDT